MKGDPQGRRLRLALAQMRVEGGAPQANLARAVRFIAEAAAEGAEAVLLPECLDLGWTHPSARELAQPLPGPYGSRLAEAAARHAVWVAAGLTERAGAQRHNTAVLFSPEGELVHRHRKVNELAFARDLYAPGRSLGVAETPWGRVGLPVCADNFPYAHFVADGMAALGASLLLSPCAWAVTAEEHAQGLPYGALWEEAYRSLARRHGMAVVGVSSVGPLTGGVWKGRLCIGASLAVGPDGEVLARGPYGPEAQWLGVVELSLPARACAATGVDLE